MAHRQRFAAGQDATQAGQVHRIIVDDGVEQCGGKPCVVGAMARHGTRDSRPGGRVLIVDHAGAAIQQRGEDLQR